MDTASNRELPVGYADVAAAAEKLMGVAHRTPALTSRSVDICWCHAVAAD